MSEFWIERDAHDADALHIYTSECGRTFHVARIHVEHAASIAGPSAVRDLRIGDRIGISIEVKND